MNRCDLHKLEFAQASESRSPREACLCKTNQQSSIKSALQCTISITYRTQGIFLVVRHYQENTFLNMEKQGFYALTKVIHLVENYQIKI